MKKFKLAVIVCHEKDAPGARAIRPLNMHEYDYVSILAGKMKSFAETSQDISFELEVFKRDNIGITGAYKRAISWLEQTPLDKCAIMEPHFNAAPTHLKGLVSGTETLYCATKDVAWANEKVFAQLVQDKILNVLETKDRGLKERPETLGEAGWFNLNQTVNYPSILPELFFGDHKEDAAKGLARMESLAQGLCSATEDFFWWGK